MRLALMLTVALAASLGSAPQEQRAGGPDLVSLFNTAGNLGFSTIRTAYGPPDQPLPPAVTAWIATDYANMRRWATADASCVAFDLSRFDAGAAQVKNARATARELWQTVDQLHRDYRAAVGKATCAFGLPSAERRDAFFLAGLFMGFATARASYFSYETPTPREAVEQIAGDFTIVLSGLRSLDGCADLAPIEASIAAVKRRLGAVPGKDSYSEIVAVYLAIEAAARTARCAPPPAALPTDPASCMKSVCAVPCKGATILLGVVSGSPDCLQCIAKNCKGDRR